MLLPDCRYHGRNCCDKNHVGYRHNIRELLDKIYSYSFGTAQIRISGSFFDLFMY